MAAQYGQLPETIEEHGTMLWFHRWQAITKAIDDARREHAAQPAKRGKAAVPVDLAMLTKDDMLPMDDELD